MQTRDEHVENHERFTRHCLDEIALRHVAAGEGSLSIAMLLTLTAAEIDYLHTRISGLGSTGA